MALRRVNDQSLGQWPGVDLRRDPSGGGGVTELRGYGAIRQQRACTAALRYDETYPGRDFEESVSLSRLTPRPCARHAVARSRSSTRTSGWVASRAARCWRARPSPGQRRSAPRPHSPGESPRRGGGPPLSVGAAGRASGCLSRCKREGLPCELSGPGGYVALPPERLVSMVSPELQ